MSMAANDLKKSMSPTITAVIATHLLGIPCNIEEIKATLPQSDVLLIEDAAAAMGAKIGGQLVGTFGDAAVISLPEINIHKNGVVASITDCFGYDDTIIGWHDDSPGAIECV